MGRTSDLSKNPIISHELFKNIAQAHGCSAGVVSLSWAVQRGTTVIPKSSTASRIDENIRLVTLSEEEMAAINAAQETIGKWRSSDGADGLHIELDGKRTFQGWTYVDFGWEDEEGNWLV